jgi:hypothetical protein
MSSEGEKCLEFLLLDGSNYESWCISILHNIKTFNPSLLSIVDASICPPNINWDDFSEEEGKCLKLNAQDICLLTQSSSPNVEALILNEYGFPMDCTLAVEVYQRKVFRDHSNTRLKRCWLSDQTGQTGLAKTVGSKLQRRKCHWSNGKLTSQTSSLPSASHGKYLMAKDKKKKKPKKVENKEEEDDKYDLDFDKLSKKENIKIKRLFERLQE